MMKCCWTVLCEKAIINEETSQLSLIEILEEIEVPQPTNSDGTILYPFGFDLVIYWKKSENNNHKKTDKFRIVIHTPLGKTLLKAEFPLNSEETKFRVISKFHFPGLPVSEEGDYLFKIEIPTETEDQWEEVSQTSLEVTYVINSEEDED